MFAVAENLAGNLVYNGIEIMTAPSAPLAPVV